MNKLTIIVIIGVVAAGIVAASSVSDQFATAGSTKKVHFTHTIQSIPSLGLGQEDHQMALVLSPNEGTIYDGSVTFTSSMPVHVMILHEIGEDDSNGQPVWTVDDITYYALTLLEPAAASTVEFTGAALGLYSPMPDEFVATLSVDGWIRGEATPIITQNITAEREDPPIRLARVNVPATIPLHTGIYDGERILYIITDGSDEDYANSLSEIQEWRVELAPPLKDTPEDILQDLYVFTNGVEDDGIYGFQSDVFSNTPAQESEYSALNSVIEVAWKNGQRESVLESVEDILEAHEGGRITLDDTGVVVNAPQIVWPDGQMTVREDPEITDGMPYGGGQITEIDEESMTVTFVAHRGWGPDGRTVYYIVTDATPQAPAGTMGVVSSPVTAGLIAHSAAVDLFQFNNGVKGSGPLGFQAGISTAALGDENYSPMWRIHLVEWHDAESAKVMETTADIDAFRDADMVTVSIARPTNSDHIVNCPFIDPFQ